MSEVLKDFSSHAILRANLENLLATWRALVLGWEGSMLVDTPQEFRYVTGLRNPIANGVLHAQFSSADADARIGETLGAFQSRRLPMFWWVSPLDSPIDLGRRLRAHGMTLSSAGPGMSVDLRALETAMPHPPDFEIKAVRDRDHLAIWRETLQAVFKFPDTVVRGMEAALFRLGLGPDSTFQHYLGYSRGRPVAIASLSYAAGVAGLYHVGTLSEARSKGIGGAMTLAPLGEARARGYQIGVLQSSRAGVGLYRRLGFTESFTIELYKLPFWWSPPLLGRALRTLFGRWELRPGQRQSRRLM